VLTGAKTLSTPIADASVAITEAIFETKLTFHDIAWPMGSGNIVPPAAPPCRPSLMKLIGMPRRDDDLNICCSSLRCCTHDLVLSNGHSNADMNLAAPTPVLLKRLTTSEPVCVAKVIAIFSSRFICPSRCDTRSSIGSSASIHGRSDNSCDAAASTASSSDSAAAMARAHIVVHTVPPPTAITVSEDVLVEAPGGERRRTRPPSRSLRQCQLVPAHLRYSPKSGFYNDS
jgi:hypothetical protein